ncbi:response regulator [Ralstonia insidiosa]|uniref:Response regulator n=1 Tax=Ralstonia insidiosa TaxID=190721 RepID=A0A848P465_9RALS|nr:response regulator [Ralstonia insidiosa]NMV39426.1 response regulator [Ralstonia insidiosa]
MTNPGGHTPTNPPKILYVDDETLALTYFGRAIGSLAPVVTATSVEEGKRMLDQHAATLGVLVSDQRMPGELGNELLRYARERYPHLVRILTTAYSEIEDTVEAVNQGQIHRYIKKPWDITALRVELKQALEFSDLRRERDALLREKMTVRQSQTLAHRIGALQTLYLAVSGLPSFSAVNDYLHAAAAVGLHAVEQPDWAVKDYTELVSEESLRTGELSHAVRQVYQDLSSRFDSTPATQALDVLTEVLQGKVSPAGGDAAAVIDLSTLTEFLETASTHKVSEAHAKWLAFLLWLDGKGWSIKAERDGTTVKLRLVDHLTQLTPDQLAGWMEHFQENQQAA